MNTDERLHRFSVGQNVSLARGYGYLHGVGKEFEIIGLLPSNGKNYQYRLRSAAENYERIAAENELTPI